MLEEIKAFASSPPGCVAAVAALADCVCASPGQKFVCVRDRQTERVRGCLIEPSLSPLALISCFPSRAGLDVSMPLVCYCRAEASVVDHGEKLRSTRHGGLLNDGGEGYRGEILVLGQAPDKMLMSGKQKSQAASTPTHPAATLTSSYLTAGRVLTTRCGAGGGVVYLPCLASHFVIYIRPF